VNEHQLDLPFCLLKKKESLIAILCFVPVWGIKRTRNTDRRFTQVHIQASFHCEASRVEVLQVASTNLSPPDYDLLFFPFRPLHFSSLTSSLCSFLMRLSLYSLSEISPRHKMQGQGIVGNFTVSGHVPRQRNAHRRMELSGAFYSRDQR
jgi:hypothetical protein